MPVKNAFSVPGGWGKDAGEGDTTSAANSEAIPRNAAGVVDKSGDIVDESGKAIGSVEDADALAGSAVTTTGDVINASGDILAKAELGDEYTTKPDEKTKSDAGWNVLGKTKGVIRTVDNIRGPVNKSFEIANSLQGKSGKPVDKGVQQGQDASNQNHVAASKDIATDAESQTKPVESKASTADTSHHQQPIQFQDNDQATDQGTAKPESAAGNKDAISTASRSDAAIPTDESLTSKDPVPIQDEEQVGVKSEPLKPTDSVSEVASRTADKDQSASAHEHASEKVSQVKSTTQDAPEAVAKTTEKAPSEQHGAEDAPARATSELAADETQKESPSELHSKRGTWKASSELAPEQLTGEAPEKDQADAKLSEVHSEKASQPAAPGLAEKTGEGALSEAPKQAQSELGEKSTVKEAAPEMTEGKAPTDVASHKPSDGALTEQAVSELGSKKIPSEIVGDAATKDEAAKQAVDQGADIQSQAPTDARSLAGTEAKTETLREKTGSQLGEPTAEATGEETPEKGAAVEETPEKEAAVGDMPAKTETPEETKDETPDSPTLKGAKVNKGGNLVDSDGDIVGRLIEGDAKKLVGKQADKDGYILDEEGNQIGRAEPVPDTESPQEAAVDTDKADEGGQEKAELDFSVLQGTKVNKAGYLVNDDGDVIGRLVEGDAKKLLNCRADEEGNVWNDSGKKLGRAEPLPEDERPKEEAEAGEDKSQLDYSVLKGTTVNKAGNLVNDNGDVIGRLVQGDAKELLDCRADEQGYIWDDSGKKVGRAEPLPEDERPQGAAEDEAKEEGEEEAQLDYSVLKGTKVNKSGNLVNDDGEIIGRLVEGDAKQLIGRRADEEGYIWNDSGKKVGRGEPIPEGERDTAKAFAPFENFPDAVVEADGRVMSEGRQVGAVIEGDPKRLKGSKVDEDGDILDRRGNIVGKAEAWDEPEPPPEEEPEQPPDRSILAGKRVNKAGNVVDSAGVIYGRVVEGNVASLIGRMCNRDGNVMSESGEVIGRAELVPEHEREGTRDGPFAELVGCTVTREGKVVTAAGDVVGRLTSGDGKVLYGRSVDEDGDVVDRNGNVLGKAERWEEPVVEKKRNALAGRRLNREGNVLDDDGNIIGRLISGDVAICAGKEVDDDGDVVNSKGMTIGHVSLLEDIPAEPEPEPEEPEESPEEKEKRQQAETDRKLAGQLSAAIEQSLDKIRPICRMIMDKIERAERTPKDELDEEQLVREVKPLIEEGGRILTETNGIIRGLDPDGRIQRNAKAKAGTREATPEEHHLADVLKELTGTVSETIDKAKRKIDGMPHAKKELNPLWGLLSEPLFQILAAVGLLLNGVLGLVGRLLNGLGLGGIIDNLLGGLGLNKILGSLGLGSALDALTGKKKK
ncbi:hypothetical protein CDD80_5547 [Ophiocordyceps camponoti-rufipedis]|uniref:DUF6987 domain-containing protein n=1 Tax=Ophiocordyceps camponoti-rufipedis TaxID=2004952 RepID=A0A2C5YUQ3_9HYPO|nr:hypothetical protein CDD80_5547 [Ophiocordyceps camponoti-rufipedis]